METNLVDRSLDPETQAEYLFIEEKTKVGIAKSVRDLNFLQMLTTETLDYFNKFNCTNQQLFALGLLERVRHATYSLKRTFDFVESEPPLVFSAGLTLRAIILDYLIMLKLIQVAIEAQTAGRTKEEMVQETFNMSGRFLADGLENTFSYYEILKSINIIDDKRLSDAFNDMAQRYSLLLNLHPGDCSRPIVKFSEAPRPMRIFKQLVTNKQIKNIALIYDAYLFFSKYDHFGIMYFDTIRTPLDKVIKHFNTVIQEILFHTMLVYSFLHDHTEGDKVVKRQFEDAGNYVNDNYNK